MGIISSVQRMVGRSRPVVGLDIGHTSVKCVQLERGSDGFRLVKHDVEPIQNGKGDVPGAAGTSDAIQRLADRWGLGNDQVVSSVSGESVIVRPIPIPCMDDKIDLTLAVQGEAREYIPFDIADVVLDYQELGEIETVNGAAREVLVVAARRELIHSHLGLLESAGLDSAIIDVGAIALVNALLAGCDIGETETLCLVNIGSDVTNIAILRHRMPRFTRDLNIAGRNITRSIMSELSVDFEAAERLKREHGMKVLFGHGEAQAEAEPHSVAEAPQTGRSIVDEVYAAIDALDSDAGSTAGMEADAGGEATVVASVAEQIFSDIASEVKRSLLFYENQMDGEPIDRLLLSGGTSLLPGAVTFFENHLDAPVQLMQPLDRIQCDLSDAERESLGPTLATGIGLALRCAAQ